MKRIKVLAFALMLCLTGAIYAAGYVQDVKQLADDGNASMSCSMDGEGCCMTGGECCTDGAECCKAKADGSHADCCKAAEASCKAEMADGDCCKAHRDGAKHAEQSCEMSKDGKAGCCNGGSCCKAKAKGA